MSDRIYSQLLGLAHSAHILPIIGGEAMAGVVLVSAIVSAVYVESVDSLLQLDVRSRPCVWPCHICDGSKEDDHDAHLLGSQRK